MQQNSSAVEHPVELRLYKLQVISTPVLQRACYDTYAREENLNFQTPIAVCTSNGAAVKSATSSQPHTAECCKMIYNMRTTTRGCAIVQVVRNRKKVVCLHSPALLSVESWVYAAFGRVVLAISGEYRNAQGGGFCSQESVQQ